MEKAITGAGAGVIVIWMCFLLLYQNNINGYMKVPEPEITAEFSDGTVEGYEEEADLIAYMLLQIQNQNLDYGLRGCAVEQLAEYFSLTYYIQYTELYPDLELIPPGDYGSSAYEAIAVSRLSEHYADLLKNGFEKLSSYGELTLLNAVEDIPEDADGKYYEHMTEVREILGARSVHEMLITVQTEEGIVDMKWTLARYKGFWKVLLFTPLADYRSTDWNIAESESEVSQAMEVSATGVDVLPSNYRFLSTCSEEDPEALLKKVALYLQKEDVWSVLAFYKLYEEEPSATYDYFERQSRAAYQIQTVFYRLFMPEDEYKEWFLRDMENRAEELVAELSTAQMIYINLSGFKVLEEGDRQMVYRMNCRYDNERIKINFHLIYDNGWKIESIEV